jgi:hypothetical protein
MRVAAGGLTVRRFGQSVPVLATVTDWITAGAAVIAAGGTTWAAVAAWRSAKASERASRETAAALVLQWSAARR